MVIITLHLLNLCPVLVKVQDFKIVFSRNPGRNKVFKLSERFRSETRGGDFLIKNVDNLDLLEKFLYNL